jgi:peptidoglycan DL-endopeptidase CwlO
MNVSRRALLIPTAMLLVVALLFAALGAPHRAAALTLKQRLKVVEQRISVYYRQVSIAVERYDNATSELQTVNAKVKANTQALAATELELGVASRTLQQQVVMSYKQPQADLLGVLLSMQSFDQLVTQLDALQRFSSQDARVVDAVQAARQRVLDLKVSLQADRQTAQKLVAETKAARDAVKALAKREEGLLGGLKKQIEAQQVAAASAARRAAQLAQQQASAPGGQPRYGGTGGSTGGGAPIVNPGGAGHPEVVAIARRYLGVPYVWGGASPRGFDCSGLVMYVYAQIGIGMPHGATLQQRQSKPVPLNALLPGDVVFFGNASFSYHDGIYVGGGMMINAPRTGELVSYASIRGAWIGGRF